MSLSNPLSKAFDRITAGLEGEALTRVSYGFTVHKGPDIPLALASIHMHESLGQAYRIMVEVVTDDVEADHRAWLGASCTVSIDRGEGIREIIGIVEKVMIGTVVHDKQQLEFHLVPALALLDQEIDSRIFQGMTIQELLTDVLKTSLSPMGRDFDVSGLAKAYNSRDYCVQYRESTYAFLCRLVEEEGITFFFEYSEGMEAETLIFVDHNEAYPSIALQVGDEIPIIAERENEADRESIQTICSIAHRRPNAVVVRGHNYRVPGEDAYTVIAEDDHHPSTRAVYVHGERRQIIDDPLGDDRAEGPFNGSSLVQRETEAIRRAEAYTAQTRILQGTSNVASMRPGVVLTLGEHPSPELDGQRFLVTSVEHEGTVSDGDADYTNTFTCIPFTHAYRPPPPKPRRVAGPLTATVVGPPGEEIYTDTLGRIRVRFHWDRAEVAPERSSCWVRVAQSLSGEAWGTHALPRVGMEVVVQFMDGNPDLPLVIGTVNNPVNIPPYALPEDKTKTGIVTASTPGGGGYNELTFQDAAGAEEIVVHAQRDYNETIKHDRSSQVGCNDSLQVGGSQSITVAGDHAHTVSGTSTTTITKDCTTVADAHRTVVVKLDQSTAIGGSESHNVIANMTTQIDGWQSHSVRGQRVRYVGGNETININGARALSSKGYFQVVQGGTEQVLLNSGKVVIQGSQQMVVSNGKSTLVLEGGAVDLQAAEAITLRCGPACITLSSDGDIVIEGNSVSIKGGGAEGVWSKGVNISGASVDVEADNAATITGKEVKLN